MQIYFDNELIYEDNYMSYEDNLKSFEDSFTLGSVASFSAKLQIPIKLITDVEGVYEDYSKPDEVYIVADNIPIATLIVDKEEFNEDETVTLSLIDKLALTSTPLDISSLITYQKTYDPDTDTWTETGDGVTAKDLLAYICTYYNIPYTYSSFTNEDVKTYSYDNTLTGRDYLSMIAELAGGYIRINEYGNLRLCTYYLSKGTLGNIPNQNITSSGLTISVEDEEISIVGATTANSAFTLNVDNGQTLKANKNYYIRYEVIEDPYDGQLTFFRLLDTNGQIISMTPTSFVMDPNQYYYFTVTEEKTLGRIQFRYYRGESYDVTFKLYLGECPNGINMSYLEADEIDSYKVDAPITIERVVYDNKVGTFFESSSDTTLTTLYLNPNNFFLQTMDEDVFENICNRIIGFTYCNIEIENSKDFFIENKGNIITLHTLEDKYLPIINNFERSYMGGFVGSYKTSFSSEQQEETKIIPTEDKINSIKTIINQQEGSLEILAGKTTKLRVDVDKIEGYFEVTPGNNLIHNSAFLLTDEVWNFTQRTGGSHTNLGEGYNGSLIGTTISLGEIKLSNCDAMTTSDNITDLIIGNQYILSFYLTNEVNSSFTITLTGGNTEVVSETITNEEDMIIHSYTFTAITSSMTLKLSNTSGTSTIYDLLLLPGENVKEWETAKGELYSTTLTMSRQGLKVFSTGSNTLTFMTADGFQIREAHLDINNRLVIGDIITKFDEYGTTTKELSATRITTSGKIISTIINVNGTDHYLEYWVED